MPILKYCDVRRYTHTAPPMALTNVLAMNWCRKAIGSMTPRVELLAVLLGTKITDLAPPTASHHVEYLMGFSSGVNTCTALLPDASASGRSRRLYCSAHEAVKPAIVFMLPLERLGMGFGHDGLNVWVAASRNLATSAITLGEYGSLIKPLFWGAFIGEHPIRSPAPTIPFLAPPSPLTVIPSIHAVLFINDLHRIPAKEPPSTQADLKWYVPGLMSLASFVANQRT